MPRQLIAPHKIMIKSNGDVLFASKDRCIGIPASDAQWGTKPTLYAYLGIVQQDAWYCLKFHATPNSRRRELTGAYNSGGCLRFYHNGLFACICPRWSIEMFPELKAGCDLGTIYVSCTRSRTPCNTPA